MSISTAYCKLEEGDKIVVWSDRFHGFVHNSMRVLVYGNLQAVESILGCGSSGHLPFRPSG